MSTADEVSLLESEFEEVTFLHDPGSGLRAVLAIHDTSLGPAAGGIRCVPYEDTSKALEDALRLARSMTRKCAIAGIPAGGGKVVIIDHDGWRRARGFRALGRYVEDMHGRFLTSRDLGTTVQDLVEVAETTRYVTIPREEGQLDLSQRVADGVFAAADCCLDILGIDMRRGMHVVIQGLGEIGLRLATLMVRSGAKVTGCDIDASRGGRAADTLPIELVAPDKIYDVEGAVFAPCAVGGILNAETIPRLKCQIIAGAANNQLADDRCAEMLLERNILLAPDFIVNAGAVMVGCGLAIPHYNPPADMSAIAETLREVVHEAMEKEQSPHQVALRSADELWRQARRQREETARSANS